MLRKTYQILWMVLSIILFGCKSESSKVIIKQKTKFVRIDTLIYRTGFKYSKEIAPDKKIVRSYIDANNFIDKNVWSNGISEFISYDTFNIDSKGNWYILYNKEKYLYYDSEKFNSNLSYPISEHTKVRLEYKGNLCKRTINYEFRDSFLFNPKVGLIKSWNNNVIRILDSNL